VQDSTADSSEPHECVFAAKIAPQRVATDTDVAFLFSARRERIWTCRRAAGWSWGYCSAVTKDGWRWIVDAHREGRRYIAHSDELLSAFLHLEATIL